MITISLCMIVKNEEAILARCLDSIKDLAEEIIIVDTGSTDKTKVIAQKYTNKIFDFIWNDDFAAARNFAFSKATKDYIYSADADEVIDEQNRKKFQDLKKTLLPEVEIVQMYYSNQLQFNTTYNFDKEYRPKLFKRLRNFQWIEPIHETIRLEPVIYNSEIEICHMPQNNHSIRDFNVFQKLFHKGVRLSKQLHNMYARELYIAGDDIDFLEAEKVFKETLIDENRSKEELLEAFCILAKGARIRGDMAFFYKNIIKSITLQFCSEICFELGMLYYEAGDYEEAVIWFYNAAYETTSILNIHYQGDYSISKIADCYYQLGIKEQEQEYKKIAKQWIEEFERK